MEAYATVEDLQACWRTLTEDETGRAKVLLEMASNYLRRIAKNNKVNLDHRVCEDCTLEATLNMVVLAAVKRAMSTPQDAPPVDQWSQAASPYSESMKFTNPSNDIFFKNNELKLLGFASVSGGSKIGVLKGVRP